MKKFNITGTCIPHLHYMVDIQDKVKKVKELVNEGLYFVISRPRQYGKTSMIYALEQKLKTEYLIVSTSFEGLGDSKFQDDETFCSTIFETFAEGFYNGTDVEKQKLIEYGIGLKTLEDVSKAITKFTKDLDKKVILIIDEVDRASNFNLFISFLGMLRDKYLKRNSGKDNTFHSIILVGVHDIKNIKNKLRPDSESVYNSPWNIATEFKIEMSFSPNEIETMLVDYYETFIDKRETSIDSLELNDKFSQLKSDDIPLLSNEIYNFTSGYPFLVSKICKLIDEDLEKDWSVEGIRKAIDSILKERNTLFDDLIKNIENNSELYNLIYNILITSSVIHFNLSNPVIDTAAMYGIVSQDKLGKLKISNKIFEVYLYEYLVSKLETSQLSTEKYSFRNLYLNLDGSLNMEKLLLKFQEFIKETYSNKDETFYERHGRLLLIAFIKPIINGEGFYYLESQQSYERRSDMIITFNKKEYILELKLWYGQQYHEEGLKQLASYLERRNQTTGYLVAFNFNKNKEFTNRWNEVEGKKIFQVIV